MHVGRTQSAMIRWMLVQPSRGVIAYKAATQCAPDAGEADNLGTDTFLCRQTTREVCHRRLVLTQSCSCAPSPCRCGVLFEMRDAAMTTPGGEVLSRRLSVRWTSACNDSTDPARVLPYC